MEQDSRKVTWKTKEENYPKAFAEFKKWLLNSNQKYGFLMYSSFESQLGAYLKYFHKKGYHFIVKADVPKKGLIVYSGGVRKRDTNLYSDVMPFKDPFDVYTTLFLQVFRQMEIGHAVRETMKKSRNKIHVTSCNNSWYVKKHYAKRALRVFPKGEKAEAIFYAKKFRLQGFEVVIHNLDGSVGRTLKPKK